MERSGTIRVCGLLALAATGATALGAAVDRLGTKTDGRSAHASLVSEATTGERVPLRTDTNIASSAGGAPMVICTQPAGNCQAPDTSNAITSDRDSRYLVAEDFTPQVDGSITEVCWRGTYWDFNSEQQCPDSSTNRFEITYYENVDGIPGSQLATFSQERLTLAVTGPVATGDTIANGLATEYEYTASHAPVNVTAGQCYWIEISNRLFSCSWLWEISAEGDGRSLQDGDGLSALDGYDRDDLSSDDMMFCLDIGLGDSTQCVPPPPLNNTCDTASQIAGDGTLAFDSFAATTTGPAHDACLAAGESQLDNDVWFCWTAECAGTALVWTCDQTDVDTKIAVYDGCDVCPPTDGQVLACNDDRCNVEEIPRQSMVALNVVAGRSYLIRLGTYPGEPGGTGHFSVGCDLPDCDGCPGTGDCCNEEGTDGPGCADETCCEAICICDPFCCEVEWVSDCATDGYRGYGCGAGLLCLDTCAICGNPSAGDCCTANGTIGCSDMICCETVCSLDPFCCEVEWDENCATYGFDDSGNGAAVQCPDLCGTTVCLDGPVTFLDPPTGTIDARQPYPPWNESQRQGIDTIVAEAPAGAERRECWGATDTAAVASSIEVANVVDHGDGTFTLTLAKPTSVGEVTMVTYSATGGNTHTGVFVSHPGNINGDAQADADDLETMINCCLNHLCDPGVTPEETPYRCDIDRSGRITPADLLRAIDLLNGGDEYDPWLNTPLPQPTERQ